MLCHRCTNLLSGLPRASRLFRRWSPDATPLGALFCDRCGGLILTGDSGEAMLGKLVQLSRFGLGADDRPLLSSELKKR